MVRKLGIKTPFRHGIPGKDWVSGFLFRHTEISLRKPQALSTCRARMLNQTVTDHFYSDLQKLLNDIGLTDQPMKIWNIDETSVPLLHKPVRVLGQTGAKNIPGRVGNNRENVSVLACVNAAGGDIPPLVIIKGKTYKSLLAYNTEEGVPGTVYTYQERAWMEDALGEMWFQDHFLKHCGPERPQLIIMDSHSSHETLGLIDAAIANDIVLLAFPPHTTQWLCPLDKSIFGPLSREYSRVCTEFMACSPNNIVNKWQWPKLFRQAYTKAFTSANITSGFKKCGIFPVNANALPKSALAPSEPFDVAITSVENPTSEPLPSLTPKCEFGPTPKVDNSTIAEYAATTAAVPLDGDNGRALSEDEFINLILSGECPYTLDPVTGSIELQIELGPSVSDPVPSSHDWSTEVNAAFTLPASDRKVSTQVNPRRLTSHRILTSKDIVDKKREDFERKEKIKVEKENRQKCRILKKEQSVSNKKEQSASLKQI
jgi:hypothetical protein